MCACLLLLLLLLMMNSIARARVCVCDCLCIINALIDWLIVVAVVLLANTAKRVFWRSDFRRTFDCYWIVVYRGVHAAFLQLIWHWPSVVSVPQMVVVITKRNEATVITPIATHTTTAAAALPIFRSFCWFFFFWGGIGFHLAGNSRN